VIVNLPFNANTWFRDIEIDGVKCLCQLTGDVMVEFHAIMTYHESLDFHRKLCNMLIKDKYNPQSPESARLAADKIIAWLEHQHK